MPLTLRVRSSQSMWRLTVPDATMTFAAVKAQIAREKQIAVASQKLTKDPQGAQELDDASRLDAAGLGANGSILYLGEQEIAVEPTPPPPAPAPPTPLAAAGRNVLAGAGDGGMSAEDQAAIAAAMAQDDAPRSPDIRRPDAAQSPEALMGPANGIGGLLEGLMNAPGGAQALAHAFQARQDAQRAAEDDIYDSDDDEDDAAVARRLAGAGGASVNDGDAVLAAFLGGGGPPPLERRLSTGDDDPALQRALLQSTRPQQSSFAAGVDAQLERALVASRAEAGLGGDDGDQDLARALAYADGGAPSPRAADDDDAQLQAALFEATAAETAEERQIAEAIRLSAMEAEPEEVLMTDAATTGARRHSRRRGGSEHDERQQGGGGSRKTD